jgi:hypothetical protein
MGLTIGDAGTLLERGSRGKASGTEEDGNLGSKHDDD